MPPLCFSTAFLRGFFYRFDLKVLRESKAFISGQNSEATAMIIKFNGPFAKIYNFMSWLNGGFQLEAKEAFTW